MKILCFTTSYNRPYCLYNVINNILNQSYKNLNYGININIDNDYDKDGYTQLLNDFTDDERLKVVFNKNQIQHVNYLNAIRSFESLEYDLFFKIDDDDIYHKDYIQKSIEYFVNNKCDILSHIPQKHINNSKIKGVIESIGKWKKDIKSNIKFGMPPTFIFNRKACDIVLNITNEQSKNIHHFEDGAWKEFWREHKLNSHIINDSKLFTYNIHKNNVSSKFLFDSDIELIENDYAIIVYCEHKHWASYVYLNKRNNRVYNINNNDHGSYKIESNKLIINWDDWGQETYDKEYVYNKIYQYKYQQK